MKRVEIPEISDERLKELARIIRPVVSLNTLPLGRYPQEEVGTYFLRLPKKLTDLRQLNFLLLKNERRSVRLFVVSRIKTLHTTGSAGRLFHPTIAEVFAQIPDRLLQDTRPENRITAFETFQERRGERDESGDFHIATTVLLREGSRPSGKGAIHYED